MTFENELQATVEVTNTCWPTHHDYQVPLVSEGPASLVTVCRLCGDVRPLEATPPPTEEPIRA